MGEVKFHAFTSECVRLVRKPWNRWDFKRAPEDREAVGDRGDHSRRSTRRACFPWSPEDKVDICGQKGGLRAKVFGPYGAQTSDLKKKKIESRH